MARFILRSVCTACAVELIGRSCAAERHMATKMTNPDFVKLAEAMHCKGMRCSEADLLSGAMEEFLASNDTPVGWPCRGVE